MPTALDPLTLAIKISDLSYTVAPFVILKFLLYHVTSQTFEGSLLLAGWNPNYWYTTKPPFQVPMDRCHTLHIPALWAKDWAEPWVFHIPASIDASAWNALSHLHLARAVARSKEIVSPPWLPFWSPSTFPGELFCHPVPQGLFTVVINLFFFFFTL